MSHDKRDEEKMMPTGNNSLINALGYVALMVMGIYFVVRHKRLGFLAKEFQRKTFNIHASEQWYRVGYLVGGIVFVIFALIELLNILKK
jgi:NhaP-type Na+/H+ or K+/H+ antiporter